MKCVLAYYVGKLINGQ